MAVFIFFCSTGKEEHAKVLQSSQAKALQYAYVLADTHAQEHISRQSQQHLSAFLLETLFS